MRGGCEKNARRKWQRLALNLASLAMFQLFQKFHLFQNSISFHPFRWFHFGLGCSISFHLFQKFHLFQSSVLFHPFH